MSTQRGRELVAGVLGWIIWIERCVLIPREFLLFFDFASERQLQLAAEWHWIMDTLLRFAWNT